MNVSRRGFLAGSALTAGLFGLAGCSSNCAAGTSTADPLTAPAADKYPIDPDKEGTEAKWSSEEIRDGWTRVTNPDGGATLGVADTAKIIQVDGYAFRDMDGDGKLSLFEDWRQSADDRAADLASQLTGEEFIQLMWHGGVQAVADKPGSKVDANDTSLLDKGSCAGVSRLGGDGDSYATVIKWINDIQTKCEARPHGIPYICSVDPYATLGIPSSVGLAPAMGKDLWRKAGMWIGRAWSSIGVRCDASRLDEASDLFYDADEPSRSMAGRAVWLHDYLRNALADELHGPDEERLVCTMLGMTDASYEFVSGMTASVYSDDTFE